MRYIRKKATPICLTEYIIRNVSHTYCKFTKVKNRYYLVKMSLAEEQGFICCYCGKRICGDMDTQIEHILPKGNPTYAHLALDYQTNLIACCDGGKRQRRLPPYPPIYCEAKKGDLVFAVNPLQQDCENKFVYDKNGDVFGLDDAQPLIDRLELNTNAVLRNERKAAIANYDILPATDWQAEYDRLDVFDLAGQLEEFCFVLRSYIYFYHL